MSKLKFDYHGKTIYSARLDIVFKALFTGGGDLTLLASFLSAVLGLEIQPGDLQVLNTELTPKEKHGKLSKLDIRVDTADNKHINIEIQLTKRRHLAKRMLYYLSKIFSRQLKVSQDYENLGISIVIAILDFRFLPYEEYHNTYRMKNVRTGDELTDVFEVNFIELPKVPLTAADSKDMWMRFLSAVSEEELDVLAEKDKILKKAVKALAAVNADEQLRYELDMIEMNELDRRTDMNDSERKGRIKQKRETVREMRKHGFSDDVIAQVLKLSIERVGKIK